MDTVCNAPYDWRMAQPVANVAVPTIIVKADDLATVDPEMCAATGLPSNHTRMELAYNMPRALYGIQRTLGLFGFFGIALAPFVRSAAVRLPIATPLWRQLRRYELAATRAIVLGIFGLILALFLRLPALALLGLAAFAVPIAVHSWKRSHWVNVGQVHDGWVKLSGCHPEFVATLETSGVKVLS